MLHNKTTDLTAVPYALWRQVSLFVRQQQNLTPGNTRLTPLAEGTLIVQIGIAIPPTACGYGVPRRARVIGMLRKLKRETKKERLT